MKWFTDLFKTKEERKNEEYEKSLDEKISKIAFFPGTQEQYENTHGYEVDVVDTNKRQKGLVFLKDHNGSYSVHGGIKFKEYIIESGVEAIINCNYTLGGNNMVHFNRFYGLPIRKK